ncbi:MAG: DUF4229 domain-containing protein [Actinomycetales bacterium]|nr:DUF4229 domain-containing protein [Actinomycetales bacterium]MCP4894567.1 DUF4229 domain-containing protein [Actinomycetales bacterium]
MSDRQSDNQSDNQRERPRRSGIVTVIVFTVLRIGLFLGVWLLLQVITPLRGLWVLVVAIILSGVISAFTLNRQRSAMGEVVGRFFGGINDRIDAASRAEDDSDEQGQDQSDGERETVSNDESAGGDESGDERGSDSP